MTQEKLRTLVNYDRNTGIFIWLERPAIGRANKIFNSKFVGKKAGCFCPRGYQYIKTEGKFYSASRLAWLYETGKWPIDEIDHINGNQSDNRFCNLRQASRSENGANRRIHSHNKSGFKGVYKSRQKWAADIRMNGIRYRLGRFDTPLKAYEAYLKKSKEIHGEFSRG